MLTADTLNHYGYFGIFIISIFEGEPVLILSGIAAQQGLLNMPLVVFLTFLSAILSDSMFFLIGKYQGIALLERSKIARFLFAKPQRFLGRNPKKMSFILRFMYGFRNIAPFSLGTTDLPYRTFFIYNTISAFIWSIIFGTLGYFVGKWAYRFFAEFGWVQIAIIIGLIIVGTLAHYLYNYLKKRLASII